MAKRSDETGNGSTAILDVETRPADNIDRDSLDKSFANEDYFTAKSDATDAMAPTPSQDSKVPINEAGEIPSEFYPIMALCFFVALLSALDRVAMSIAILPMASEFGYTETIKGQISSAVSIGYGAAILPIGLLVAVASPRWIMAIGVSLWSVATLGTPLAAGSTTTDFLVPLLGARAIMGAAEAVVLPTMQRILSDWVPPEKKATALATVLSGFQTGTVGAYLVSPWIMDQFGGWRGLFYIYGALGLLWLVPWMILAKDAPEGTYGTVVADDTFLNSMIDDDDFDIDDPNKEKSTLQKMGSVLQSAPWSTFATSRGVWGMTLAHAAKNWGLYNLLAWTPTFYSEQYGLNVKESAIYSIVPSLCGAIGGLTAGNLADYVLSKGGEDGSDAIAYRTNVRKLFQGLALFGPAACLLTLSGLPEDVTVAQALLGGTIGLQAFDAAGFGAATQEKAGKKWSGLLYSLTSLPGVMVGSVSVYATGQILDMTDGAGWPLVFQLNTGICIVGALSFLLLYDSKQEFE